MSNTSPSAVERLRRTVEHNWAILDSARRENADADEDSAEKLSLDNSLMREGSDIEKISAMLKEQLDLNNKCLEDYRQAQEELARRNQEDRMKEKRFADTMAALNLAREDAMDLKRKVSVFQDQAQKAQDEAERYRVDAAVRQREADQMAAALDEAQQEVGRLQQEKEDLRRESERIAKERRNLEEELARVRDEDAVRAAERRADLDLAGKEAFSAKSRVGPLEAELKAERVRSQELADALDARTEELKECQQQLAQAKANLFQQKERANGAVAAEKDLERELEEKMLQLAQAEAKIQSAAEMVAATEADSREMQRQKAELTQARKDMDNELRDLKLQLEAVGNDLHAMAIGRRADRDRAEAKIAQLQAELDASNQEARAIGRSLADEGSRKEAAFAEQRRALDEIRTRLQDDNAQLRETLAGYQREHAARQQEFQAEREAYEERLAELARRQRHAEAQLSTRDLANAEEATRLREKVLEAQQQLNQRTRVHVDTLSALESSMQRLAGDCQRLQAAHDGLLDEAELMRAAMKNYAEKGDVPIEEWHADTKRSMQALVDSLEQAEQEAKDARELQLQAEAQRDVERGRTFMLEEERTRLEEELQSLQEKLRTLDKSFAEKLRKAHLDVEAAVAAKTDAETALRRLQDQLERANSTSRAVQSDLDRSHAALEEAQTRARDKLTQAEERISKLEAGIIKAEAERDAAIAEQQLLRKKVEGQAREISDLARELKALEEQKRGAGLQETKELAEVQKKYHLAMENFHKQGAQVTSLKALVNVMTTQKTQAQEENKALKAQLDDLLSRTIQSTLRDSSVQMIEGDERKSEPKMSSPQSTHLNSE